MYIHTCYSEVREEKRRVEQWWIDVLVQYIFEQIYLSCSLKMSSYSACEDGRLRFLGACEEERLEGENASASCMRLDAGECEWTWIVSILKQLRLFPVMILCTILYMYMYVQPDKLIVLVQTSTCTYHRRACRERGNDHFTDRWGRGNSALHSGVRNSNSKDEDLQDKLSGPSDARGEGYVHIIEKETLGYNVSKLSYMSFRFVSFPELLTGCKCWEKKGTRSGSSFSKGKRSKYRQTELSEWNPGIIS